MLFRCISVRSAPPLLPTAPRLFDGKLMSGARFILPKTKVASKTDPLAVDIQTHPALVKEDLAHRHAIWRSLGIDPVGRDWLEDRFQTINATSPELREFFSEPDHYVASIVEHRLNAFTLALSDYIHHQSDHHRSLYRELGIHPDDMRRLQADLPIATPDAIIRAKTPHHLPLGFDPTSNASVRQNAHRPRLLGKPISNLATARGGIKNGPNHPIFGCGTIKPLHRIPTCRLPIGGLPSRRNRSSRGNLSHSL